MYGTDRQTEKVVLIAVDPRDDQNDLNELALLVETSGGEAVGRLMQKRDAPHPGHYFGTGKLEELKDLIALENADAVVCDDELSASQLRNMKNILPVTILDRTQVILDIFAKRALTMEGKLQVELAQLKYRISHLAGLGVQLSRLGGGIGTRGPGEKKLETDRRRIRERITQLNHELSELVPQRALLRQNRKKAGFPVAALVGYTNAGKSTLMNTLTGAGVFVEDKLFATLDTTTRKAALPGGGEVLFTDTVGFIEKLPHHLIQAFRATLDEVRYADVLVHVMDASSPRLLEQYHTVIQTLKELGCMDKPLVAVWNKCDLPEGAPIFRDAHALAHVRMSALTGEGQDGLLRELEGVLQRMRQKTELLIPYSEGRLIQLIHSRCEIVSEEHHENGTVIQAYLDKELEGRLQMYQTVFDSKKFDSNI
ncbi:MAG: GTPase HflX [Clostridiales bacterium]|jgi:GTP-binding protein HflX|nr:GTPase HflX [Clostridiales bacterium]